MIVKFLATAGISFVCVYALLHGHPLSSLGLDHDKYGEQITTKRILLIGNSRTYYHDMPVLLTKIAESSNGSAHFAITIRAWGGASLEDNWSDSQTQNLMTKRWDNVVIQAESRAQSGQAYEDSFFRGASDLSYAAIKAKNTVSFIVNYAYDKTLFHENPDLSRRWHCEVIARDFAEIKKRYDADLIPVAEAWESLLARQPHFALYEDGNHPTLHGSFFQALIIFAHLTHSDAATVAYYPNGIQRKDFDLMKSVVKDMFDRDAI